MSAGASASGGTRAKSSARSAGFSTVPTTVSVRPPSSTTSPMPVDSRSAAPSVRATSPLVSGKRPSRRASRGRPNPPPGSWARRSRGSADPGTATGVCPMTSSAPNRWRAAATSAWAWAGSRPSIWIRPAAFPILSRLSDAALTAIEAPATAAATAMVTRLRTRSCWRHSLRNIRHAQRSTARRPGPEPFPSALTAAVGGRPPAATPVPRGRRSGRPPGRRGGTPPGRPTPPAGRRG